MKVEIIVFINLITCTKKHTTLYCCVQCIELAVIVKYTYNYYENIIKVLKYLRVNQMMKNILH